jgi:cell division protein FtsQ
MFGVKKRRRRRSELRLGTKTVNYQTTASRPRLSISPVLRFWQLRGAKLSGLVILAWLGWVVYILFSTPLFFAYGAEIQGNIAVSGREIYAASGVDSQSVFWINPVEVVDRILTLPNIKSASVSVSLPAKITIEVVERRPEILWQTDETIWWVDEEGTIVPPKGNIDGMLRIIDDDRQPLQAGYRIDQTIVKGAQMLRIMAPDVSVIRHSRQQGLTVATPEGWPVYLGDGSEVKAKLIVLTALLADLEERNVTPAFIDVRNPLRPFYRPKNIIEIGQPTFNQSRLQSRPPERP